MKLTIPEPCHENWENMTLDEKGRFCAICSKTVRDFTSFSDEELVSQFASNEKSCGRFHKHQLNRNLSFSMAAQFALGLLATSGIVTTIRAQEIQQDKVILTDRVRGLNSSHPFNDSIYKNKTIQLGAPSSRAYQKPLILLNGKRISEEEMRQLLPENVKSIRIFSGDGAQKLYGKKGENGVIVIKSKK